MNSSENSHSERRRTNRSPSAIRRSNATIRPTASSAVARVSTSGVFVTRTPRAAAAREIDVVDADRVVRDDAELRAGALEVGVVDARRERDEDPVGSLGLVDQLEVADESGLDLGRHRRGEVDARRAIWPGGTALAYGERTRGR